MIRVLIVDDHTLVREGLTRLLERAGYCVVGEAVDAVTGLARVEELLPDVVLWDLIMPGGGLHSISKLPQGPRVLVLTAVDDVLLASEVSRAGAHGYLPKTVSPQVLADAVARVARGEHVFPPFPVLSARESEVLELLSGGRSNCEIAERLEISVKTVEAYLERLKEKLGKESTADLRAWAARR